MCLRQYKQKRDFRRTPEPSGAKAPGASGRRFVVQKHDASRLHYDFRLELDGALKSWAVPKGPSLDPHVKSLAVHVEDHPLDYADFEGVIPQGEYGGGTVMVWDRGEWLAEDDPVQAYRQGKLKFQLDGEKLHGGWALVRMGGRAGEQGKNWLLIKHKDAAAKPFRKYDVLREEPKSVLSGRDLAEIAAAPEKQWTSRAHGKASRAKPSPRRTRGRSKRSIASLALGKTPGARKAPQPSRLRPQLATLTQNVPEGDGWLHELKFDGYRIQAFVKDGRARLVSRNGKDWTHRFPSVAAAVVALPIEQAILDGEVVALTEEGVSDFQRLQNALKRSDETSLAYYAFDLPYAAGFDLKAAPLASRKAALAKLLKTANRRNDGVVRYSDHIEGEGNEVLRHACASGMEGIVSKDARAPYEPGRSRSWLKVKCIKRQEFVVAGYTKPKGTRVGLGALLLGYYKSGELVYAGRVGTGFTDESLRELARRLRALRTARTPFAAGLTAAQTRGVTWVRPELVAEAAFSEWTDEGLLRHPTFEGLREDKPPAKITREEPQAVPRHTPSSAATSRSVAGVHISNPDRVLYPEAGVTKLDLADYYAAVGDWILPHLENRPLTLVRCPAGLSGRCFYQKHLTESLPDAVHGVMIVEKEETDEYVVIDDLRGLISLVQMGVLELHPWPARADNVEAPDRLVFDLDPGDEAPWKAVVEAARRVRRRLNNMGLECFLRTSGGKGLHVVAPLVRRTSWDDLKEFARALAESLVREAPDQYIATMSKAKRRGKVFVDYLRNQRGATAVASYSSRARPGAPVATPLAWDELSARIRPNAYTVLSIRKRLESLSKDPWNGFFDVRQSITRAMQASLAASRE